MDDVTRRRIECFDECDQWFSDHSVTILTSTVLTTKTNLFSTKLATVHTKSGEGAAAKSESEEQTGVKSGNRSDCVAIAVKVNTAAKAAEPDQPGIQARYPYPRNLNDEDLIALLRSYVIGGGDDETIIADYGAPADWVAQCGDAADAFEASQQAQSSAKDDRVGTRAFIQSEVDAIMQLKATITLLIKNVFNDDVAALASWTSASHVENPPVKKKPPTPPDNGSGDGGSGDPPPTP